MIETLSEQPVQLMEEDLILTNGVLFSLLLYCLNTYPCERRKINDRRFLFSMHIVDRKWIVMKIDFQ